MPEMPRLALGGIAIRPVTDTFGKTSTQREFDELSASSKLRDWMRETGYFAKRPYHKKGTAAWSLHSEQPPYPFWYLSPLHNCLFRFRDA